MRTKNKSLLLLALTALPLIGYSQQAQTESEAKSSNNSAKTGEQEIAIKPIVTILPAFYTGFYNENKNRGFVLDRSYVGVAGSLGNGLSFKSILDIGNSKDVSDFDRFFYVKLAGFTWEQKNYKISAGLIPTNLFTIPEAFWGRRYVAKSFTDEYGFGWGADLGVSAELTATKWLSFDAIISNGEGFKQIQLNRGLLYGLGLNIRPLDGLLIRAYGEINEDSDDGTAKKTIASLIGYKNQRFSIGVEGNFLFDVDATKDKNEQGLSAYGSVTLSKKTNLYARYDYLTSKDDWNVAKDGNWYIVGFEYNASQHVKLSPNFRLREYKATEKENQPFLYISALLNL